MKFFHDHLVLESCNGSLAVEIQGSVKEDTVSLANEIKLELSGDGCECL